MKLTKPCIQCGREIFKSPQRSLKDWNDRTKYCSKSCLHEAMKLKMKGNKWNLGKKLSVSTRLKMSLAQNGEKHSQWKRHSISYHGLHQWLIRVYGKASRCENVDCVYPRKGAKKMLLKPCGFEWSLRKKCKYVRDRNNFIQLCVACHRKYDSTDIEYTIQS